MKNEFILASQNNLAFFGLVYSGGTWLPYKHSKFIADNVQRIAETPNGRLILVTPSRKGKSEICGVLLPAWYLKKYPDKEIIYTCYSKDLSEGKSGRALDLYQSIPWGLPLSKKTSGKKNWRLNNEKAGLRASGVDGGVTGFGADLLIIDDVLKDMAEARSPARREKAWMHWDADLRTRLNSNASIIIIGTRWHHDDLIGRLIESQNFETIVLPEIADESDPLNRQKDELLWPEKYDIEAIRILKKEISQELWMINFDCKPTKETGYRFKSSDFRYYDETDDYYILYDGENEYKYSKSDCKIYQTIDTAGTESKTANYTVCLTYAVTPDNRIIYLDLFREKTETVRHREILKNQDKKWNPVFQGVENKVFGINIIQSAKAEGRPLKKLIADVDKWTRSEQIVVAYENHMVYHPKSYLYKWVSILEDELKEFDKGKHDDIVDTVSYAGILVYEKKSESSAVLATGYY